MNSHDNAEALLRTLSAPRRNHYFYGKRMDVQHFEMEQSYGKLKQWMLNRLTLGKGVLCGLKVSVDGERICVDPGVAIDGLGREIVVPVRSCIDPLADEGCCGSDRRDSPERPREGLFTVWVCYHQCLTGQEPALVSDCDTRSHCAASTVIETFCLKVTKGLAPLQGDPEWCPTLWKESAPEHGHDPVPAPAPAAGGHDTHVTSITTAGSVTATDAAAIKAALESRRHQLCEMFDCDCGPGDAQDCVPLAVIALRDGRYLVEECLVRPRIYSNAKLLDLILCLADKIDHCCKDGGPTPQPVEYLRVRAVDFVNRSAAAGEALIVSMSTPLQDTAVEIARDLNAIRLKLSRPLDQGQHMPTTHGVNDGNFKRHNVQIVPDDPLGGVPYVPGTLTLESGDTVRFDLDRESPYCRPNGGWQKGRYRIFLRGNDNLAGGEPALADTSGKPLDGDPIAPADGFLSGDNVLAGDFNAFFVVGGRVEPQPQPDTLRVRSVEFIGMTRAGVESVLAQVKPPDSPTQVPGAVAAIRVRFNQPCSQVPKFVPSTHGLNDNAFATHNFQVLVDREDADRVGSFYVPGTLVFEAPDVVRFEVVRGSRVVGRTGNWPRGRLRCRLYMPGKRQDANSREPISDLAGNALDGEIMPLTGGVISGKDGPGGDFVADFVVQMPG